MNNTIAMKYIILQFADNTETILSQFWQSFCSLLSSLLRYLLSLFECTLTLYEAKNTFTYLTISPGKSFWCKLCSELSQELLPNIRSPSFLYCAILSLSGQSNESFGHFKQKDTLSVTLVHIIAKRDYIINLVNFPIKQPIEHWHYIDCIANI